MFKLWRYDPQPWPWWVGLVEIRLDDWDAFSQGWDGVAMAATTKQLVGTWRVRPNTTMKWLNGRHPGSTYFIQSTSGEL